MRSFIFTLTGRKMHIHIYIYQKSRVEFRRQWKLEKRKTVKQNQMRERERMDQKTYKQTTRVLKF